jgi:hypothetical protein
LLLDTAGATPLKPGKSCSYGKSHLLCASGPTEIVVDCYVDR